MAAGEQAGPSSMTGFGRGVAGQGAWQVTVELKAVNHRYLDIAPRIPRDWALLEQSLRKSLRRRFRRGRIDVQVRVEQVDRAPVEVRLNRDLARSLLETSRGFAREVGLADELSLGDLLRLSGVVEVGVEEQDRDEAAVAEIFETALDRAAGQLEAMRRHEGAALASDLLARIERLRGIVRRVEHYAPALVAATATGLRRRLDDLLGPNPEARRILDEGRLEVEVALLAERADVTEEITRALAHLDAMERLLRTPEGRPIGRRLDFLCQELFRELNTMGTKAASVDISPLIVEGKATLEKIREQVQNLE